MIYPVFQRKKSLLLLLFLLILLFIDGAGTETPEMNMNDYKRQYREIDDETKKKISLTSRNKPKSEQHKLHISQAMEKYWQKVPHRPNDNNNEV